MVETQQQSDTTYRLYDYGRPRELHLKDGLAAVKEKVESGKVVRPAPQQIGGSKKPSMRRWLRRLISWWICLRQRIRCNCDVTTSRDEVRCRFWWRSRAAA